MLTTNFLPLYQSVLKLPEIHLIFRQEAIL